MIVSLAGRGDPSAAAANLPVMLLPFAFTEAEVSACGDDPGWVCLWVLRETDAETAAQAADWLLARPFNILLTIVLALVASRLVRRAIDRLVARLHARDEAEGATARLRTRAQEAAGLDLERGAQRAQTLGNVLRSVSVAVIWGLAGLVILAEVGINSAPLIAGAGIAGVALGFGAQALVRDFLSGLFMMVEDQYGVGDIVDLGEANGTVEAVSLRTTRLRAVDGTVWHVPNGEVGRVGNMSQ